MQVGARLSQRGRCLVRAAAEAAADTQLAYNRILLTVLDANPQLSDGSKQAIAAAAELARQHNSKVTALLVDVPSGGSDAAAAEAALKAKCENVSWQFRERGLERAVEVVEFKLVSASEEDSNSSAIVGDVADEVGADLVILSSEAVHAKHVDANLLAEFVPCPVLLLP